MHGRRRRIGLTLFMPSCRGVRRHGQRDLFKEWPESGLNILRDPFPCSESFPYSFSYPVKCRRPMRSDSHVAITALSAVLWPCKQLLWWPSWRLSRQDLKPNRHLKSRAVTLIFMSRLISVKSFHNKPPWLLLLALSLMHAQYERFGNGDRPRTSHMEALLLFWRRTVTALGLFLDRNYLGVTCTTRVALPLNGMYLLCSWTQYPVEVCALTPSCSLILPNMWPAVEVSNSAVGILIELWLTCCHGNSHSPTMGQKCFYLPVLHKQSG